MKHLLVIGTIVGILVVLITLLKEQLFYKDIEMKDNSIKVSTSTDINKNSFTKAKEEKQKTIKDTSSFSKQNQEIKKQPKKQEFKIIEVKGIIKKLDYKNNTLIGEIQTKDKTISFEMKYDTDLELLLKDAKEYNIPLTFVIKTNGEKNYIEEIK